MIQFNLLPDVKIEYIKSQRTKRLVMLITVIVTGASVGLLVLMFSYRTVQRQHLSNLNKDIAALRSELENNQDLTKILTVQNQLNSLPQLYEGRPAVDRLPEYLDQITPANVGIGQLDIDFALNTLQITGTATNLSAVNAYVDTLKFTTFSVKDGASDVPAFQGVVLSSYNLSEDGAGFSVNLTFDPQIFIAANEVELKVPNIVTTRAQTVPSDLFRDSSSSSGGGN